MLYRFMTRSAASSYDYGFCIYVRSWHFTLYLFAFNKQSGNSGSFVFDYEQSPVEPEPIRIIITLNLYPTTSSFESC
jgi:hypothetical protein